MASFQSKLISVMMRAFFKNKFCRSRDVNTERAFMSKISRLTGGGRPVGQTVSLGAFSGEWLEPATPESGRVILSLHSGGFVFFGPEIHRDLAGRLADETGAKVFIVDYRLAPEHRFPCALDDCVEAYKYLLDSGISPDKIAIVGESAGGDLATASILRLRKDSLPLPAAVICISPVVDLSMSGRSMFTKALDDPSVTPAAVKWMIDQYLDGHDPADPMASPLFGDLSGFPPLLLQVGSEEILRDDSVRFHEAALAVNVDSTLEIWDGQMHVWHSNAKFLPEARKAIESLGDFLRKHIH